MRKEKRMLKCLDPLLFSLMTPNKHDKFSQKKSSYFLDTDSSNNLHDWENVKFNNLKYSLPPPSHKAGFARKAEMYLKHGILK